MVGPRSRFRRAVREVPLRRAPNGSPAVIAAGLARWIIHSLPPAPEMEPPELPARRVPYHGPQRDDADPALRACQAKQFSKVECRVRQRPLDVGPCRMVTTRKQRVAARTAAEAPRTPRGPARSSLGSPAVGMTEHLPIMIIAVFVAVLTMLLAADPLARFIHNNPTV